MSSADMWRVALPSRISRIFRRGTVTFKPALRRSLPSTRASPAERGSSRCGRSAIRYDCHDYYPPSGAAAPTLGRIRRPGAARDDAQRLRLSHEHPAGQLPGRQDRRSAAGRHDPQPGALPPRDAAGARDIRQGPLGLRVLLQARAPAQTRGASPDRVLHPGQGDTPRTRQRAECGTAGAGPGTVGVEVPDHLKARASALAAAALALHALAAPLARIAT